MWLLPQTDRMVVYTQHEATIRTKAESATNARSMLWPPRRRECAPARAALLLIAARRAAAVSSGATRSVRLRNRDGATIGAHKQPERTAAAAASVSRTKTWQTRAAARPWRALCLDFLERSEKERREVRAAKLYAIGVALSPRRSSLSGRALCFPLRIRSS